MTQATDVRQRVLQLRRHVDALGRALGKCRLSGRDLARVESLREEMDEEVQWVQSLLQLARDQQRSRS